MIPFGFTLRVCDLQKIFQAIVYGLVYALIQKPGSFNMHQDPRVMASNMGPPEVWHVYIEGPNPRASKSINSPIYFEPCNEGYDQLLQVAICNMCLDSMVGPRVVYNTHHLYYKTDHSFKNNRDFHPQRHNIFPYFVHEFIIHDQ